jgi:hypothetical protein
MGVLVGESLNNGSGAQSRLVAKDSERTSSRCGKRKEQEAFPKSERKGRVVADTKERLWLVGENPKPSTSGSHRHIYRSS